HRVGPGADVFLLRWIPRRNAMSMERNTRHRLALEVGDQTNPAAAEGVDLHAFGRRGLRTGGGRRFDDGVPGSDVHLENLVGWTWLRRWRRCLRRDTQGRCGQTQNQRAGCDEWSQFHRVLLA